MMSRIEMICGKYDTLRPDPQQTGTTVDHGRQATTSVGNGVCYHDRRRYLHTEWDDQRRQTDVRGRQTMTHVLVDT